MDAMCSYPLDFEFKVSKYKSNNDLVLLESKKCKKCSIEAISNLFFVRYSCIETPQGPGVHYNVPKHVFVKISKETDWFNCDQCNYSTRRLGMLSIHILRRHTDKESLDWIKCESCDYKTKVKKNYDMHLLRSHQRNPKVTCNYCNFLVAKHYLNSHIAQIHDKNIERHKCGFCEKTFKWKDSVQKHVKRQHVSNEEKRWQNCQYCDFKTLEKQQLKFHTITKHRQEDGKWHECSMCQFRTLHKRDFRMHILRKHTENENISWLECAFCEYKSKTKGGLTSHVQRRHKTGQKT